MWNLCVQQCSGDVAKYHPSAVWYAHVPLLSVLSYTCTDMPIGASGILLQFNGPLRWAYAKTLGVALDYRNRLIVISSCGKSLFHDDGGKSCAVPISIIRKCALKFRMATSAEFLRCVPCGISSSFIFYSSCIIVFRASDTSLSSMCFLGIIPDHCSLNIIALYARMSSSSLRLFMGSTSITLLSISTIIMMYLLPRCDHVGNCPVWLENTVLRTSYTLVYMSHALCPWSVSILGTLRGVRLGLVDLTFFLDQFRWLFGVSLVSG